MQICTTVAQFKSLIGKGAVGQDFLLRKAGPTIATSLHGDRVLRFTISTAAVDRDNDTVSLTGWKMDAFKSNPVVLWSHRAGDLPIGKCVAIGVEGDALKADVEFVPADMPLVGEQAEAIFRMCQTGFLSATSVGFRPLEYDLAKERMGDDDWFPPVDFTSQELMEFSVCSIPCNPEALIDPTERLSVSVAPNEAQRAAAAAKRRALRAAYA